MDANAWISLAIYVVAFCFVMSTIFKLGGLSDEVKRLRERIEYLETKQIRRRANPRLDHVGRVIPDRD